MSTRETGGLAATVALLLLLPASGEAIPAFARQFGVKCTTCHTPVPPRLNNVGITFKRMGYRMPDADDEGRLVLKEKPSRTSFDDFSIAGDFRGEKHRGEPGEFAIDEFFAPGAGAIGRHLSYAAEVAWEDGEFELETAEGQVLFGKPTANGTVRFGMLKPLLWEKGNHQLLGVSTPLLIGAAVPVGEFAGSPLNEMRTGIEAALNLNHLGEGGASRNTLVSVALYDRLRPGGEMGEAAPPPEEGMGEPSEGATGVKDVLAQAMHLFGADNSVAVLYYRGKVFDIGDDLFTDRVERWAVMGNYRLRSGTDLLAAFGGGRDTTTAADIGRVKSQGWYVEVDQAIGSKTVALARWDRFEPDRGVSDLDVSGPTLSLTHHVLDNLILTAEYQGLKVGEGERNQDFVVRAIVIY